MVISLMYIICWQKEDSSFVNTKKKSDSALAYNLTSSNQNLADFGAFISKLFYI